MHWSLSLPCVSSHGACVFVWIFLLSHRPIHPNIVLQPTKSTKNVHRSPLTLFEQRVVSLLPHIPSCSHLFPRFCLPLPQIFMFFRFQCFCNFLFSMLQQSLLTFVLLSSFSFLSFFLFLRLSYASNNQKIKNKNKNVVQFF